MVLHLSPLTTENPVYVALKKNNRFFIFLAGYWCAVGIVISINGYYFARVFQ
jgi:hypothetical protein